MGRTASTRQVAAALHVKPATVRKYAREDRIPYDVTPGGHRRFDVGEAVAAVRGAVDGEDLGGDLEEGTTAPPFARVRPATVVSLVASARVRHERSAPVHDSSTEVDDWAAEDGLV